jgi:diguanylate cyclase (GGDEF)-like protein
MSKHTENCRHEDIPPGITELLAGGGTQLLAALLQLDDGIQLWSGDGHSVFVNPVTTKQFGPELEVRGVHCDVMSNLCRNEAGLAMPAQEFPVQQVLASKQPSGVVLVQAPGSQGRRRWLQISARPVFDATTGGLAGVFSTSIDVTSLVDQGRRLQQQAHYDELTLLPNRALLFDRLRQSLARSQRTGQLLAVCMMDLDGFKPVNDNHGHDAGDRLLQEIAHRLKATTRADDTVARVGGDEFVILMEELASPLECERALRRILEAVAKPFTLGPDVVRVTASIGVSLYPGDVADLDQLLRHADQAMYRAKESGRNRYQMFDPLVESRLRANRTVIQQISRAIADGQLHLLYQPKVDCRRGRVVGLEALVRWNHPVLGTRAPAEFLPLIEQDETVIRLGEWVASEALRQLAAWDALDIDLPISINVSPYGFLRGSFDQGLEKLLKRHPHELVQRLELEILESGVVEDFQLVSELIRRFQALGVRVALDDFGTGYSSLLHLKRLGVDALKIDQTFVRDMLDDASDLAIVRAVIGMAAALKNDVVAEGVESIEQTLLLLRLGCHVMQGFGIARPMEAGILPAWLATFRSDPRWRAAWLNYPKRSDFDLLLMEVAHRHWFRHVRDSVRRPRNGNNGVQLDYDRCKLAQWYTGTGMRQFGAFPQFREIDTVHRRVHTLARDLAATGSNASPDAAETERALGESNDELVSRLHHFRLALLGTNDEPDAKSDSEEP